VIFPILEAIHVMGLALSVGTIVMVDLWLLGWREGPIAKLERWTWAGFAVMLFTGAALFLSNVPRYVHNPGFLLKMGLLAVALLAHLTIHRKALSHRKATRGAAILSLTLWSSVVISSRFIADLDA
jgi:hypothetical protein